MTPGDDILFTPLQFRRLQTKNRLWRSSMTGRFDHYDGSGSEVRINWERRFARNGVGAIVSAHVPVSVRGRIMPNVAMIDRDERIPFWNKLVAAVHESDCKYLIQLSHAGRQRDIRGIENLRRPAQSSTGAIDEIHGLRSRAMTVDEIASVVEEFGLAAERAQEAGADGVETHSANGYLFTQFLSPTINDRKDGYGVDLPGRARFLREVIRRIRRGVGPDFHVQVKLSALDYADSLNPFASAGTTLDESIQVARWCVEDGADAIVVSAGAYVPHPKMPPGDFPLGFHWRSYGELLDSGRNTFRNYLVVRWSVTRRLASRWWAHRRGPHASIEGMHVPAARAIKQAVPVPVLVTGGFQHADSIRSVIRDGSCDGVTIARPLIANPDLVRLFEQGQSAPAVPCSYCNACLAESLRNPLGCYDVKRFGGNYERMIDEIMDVYRI